METNTRLRNTNKCCADSPFTWTQCQIWQSTVVQTQWHILTLLSALVHICAQRNNHVQRYSTGTLLRPVLAHVYRSLISNNYACRSCVCVYDCVCMWEWVGVCVYECVWYVLYVRERLTESAQMKSESPSHEPFSSHSENARTVWRYFGSQTPVHQKIKSQEHNLVSQVRRTFVPKMP